MARVLISETAVQTILDSAAGAHPLEAGGLLVGVRAGPYPWITHALEVPSTDVSGIHYVFPAGITHSLIRHVRRVDKRLGYLGEWHVHPADVGPSPTDVRTIATIADSAPNPILAIARRTAARYTLDVMQWQRAGLGKVELVTTGGLSGGNRRSRVALNYR